MVLHSTELIPQYTKINRLLQELADSDNPPSPPERQTITLNISEVSAYSHWIIIEFP